MKAKMLLVMFLSIFVTQAVYADIEILVQNHTAAGENVDVRVCAGVSNCTGWLISSVMAYNGGMVTKPGPASSGNITIDYKVRKKIVSRSVQLPAALSQYNDLTVVLTIIDNRGSLNLHARGNDYPLVAHYSEDV